ncbi:MAG: outer membrane protein assembly factor BamB [Pseudoxanthomonas sp.]
MQHKSIFLQRVLVVSVMALALGGCSTVKGWFSSKDSDKKSAEPAELVKLKNSVAIDKIWTASAGDGEKKVGTRQRPAVSEGRVYAAAIEGGVRAFDLQSGKGIWRYKSDARISSVGAGEGLVVAGTLDGELIALDAGSGEEKWKAKINSEVIAAPSIGQNNVVVHSNDGRVSAYDASNGERRWFWNHELPSLTVRGGSPVTLAPNIVFVGNDDGTLTALNLADGRQMWNQVIGNPEGRTELERMADVDGAPVIDGTTLLATSFKRDTVAIDGPSGRPMWSRDNGGMGGIGVSSAAAVVTDPDGGVWALDKATGGSLWSNTTLARRSVTAPAVQGDYAVVADYQGYLHWLRLDNGEAVARKRAGGDPIKGQPVVVDGILIVQNTDGKLTAFKLR